MQFQYGYPTPPASPSPFELPKCAIQQPPQLLQQQQSPLASRFVPPAPEERLGRFLTGTPLQLTGILGTGAYGVVYSAVDIKTHVRYAVKTLSKYNADGSPLDRRQMAFQNREIKLHWLASAHPNVVSMLKIIEEVDCVYVILEYCPEGDLFYNITERGQYVGKDDLARSVFLQILHAVEHCHSQGIYHRDLKPENILVSNQGETVKLADFGLATSSDRSEDYGCGSTFYMSPECLDHTTRRPFYFCAPNDVWSLGVILVNLTCGRNPWKQASFEDSTYRAYTRSQGFLKTILPVSDELNDILARIFTRNPDERITLPELKARIAACPRLTEQPQQQQLQPLVPVVLPLVAPPASPEHTTPYVDENAIIDDEDEEELSGCYDAAPLSPASSDDSLSDASDFSSDDGASTTSSCPSELDEDEDDDLDCPEPRGAVTPPPPHQMESPAAIYDPEAPQLVGYHPTPEYVQFAGPMMAAPPAPEPMVMAVPLHPQVQAPVIQQPVPIHVPSHFAACAPKPAPAPAHFMHLPLFLDTMCKYAHAPPAQAPMHHHISHPFFHHNSHLHQAHQVPFHHQMPMPMFACH